MNPEQQRIAIAEACGWKLKSNGLSPMWSWQNESLIHRIKWVAHKVMASQGVLPDYLNDLNAMHEAEETLDASQCAEYARQLMKHHPTYCVTVLDNRFAPTEEIAYQTYQLLHATATQRAEAFLRTIGKWEESK